MKGALLRNTTSCPAKRSVTPLIAVPRLAINADKPEHATSKLQYDVQITRKEDEDWDSYLFRKNRCRSVKTASALPPLKAQKVYNDKPCTNLSNTVALYDRLSYSKQLMTTESLSLSPNLRRAANRPHVSTQLLLNTTNDKQHKRKDLPRPKTALPRHSDNFVTYSGKRQTYLNRTGKVTHEGARLKECRRTNPSQSDGVRVVVDQHTDDMIAENCGRLGSIDCTEKCLRWLEGL